MRSKNIVICFLSHTYDRLLLFLLSYFCCYHTLILYKSNQLQQQKTSALLSQNLCYGEPEQYGKHSSLSGCQAQWKKFTVCSCEERDKQSKARGCLCILINVYIYSFSYTKGHYIQYWFAVSVCFGLI